MIWNSNRCTDPTGCFEMVISSIQCTIYVSVCLPFYIFAKMASIQGERRGNSSIFEKHKYKCGHDLENIPQPYLTHVSYHWPIYLQINLQLSFLSLAPLVYFSSSSHHARHFLLCSHCRPKFSHSWHILPHMLGFH